MAKSGALLLLVSVILGFRRSGAVSDAELSAISEQLFASDGRQDLNNLFKLNLQGRTSPSKSDDFASSNLFSGVSPHLGNSGTMRSLKALYDNYKPLVTDQETDTAQENQEVDKFLDDILASDVMIQAHQFLGRKKLAPSSAKAFRDEMKRLWFEHYPRAKGTLSSNGFEHVFMGEIKNKEVSGFHSWLYFINQEALGNLNYKGWIKRLSMGHVSLLKAQFEWEGERKPLTSMFVGSSPELEMALYTICFKTRSGKECPLTGNGKTFSIQTHPLTYQGKTYIGSAFPQF